MKTKILILALLIIFFSCSQKLTKRKNFQLNGKVMVKFENISLPIKTKIIVYQKKRKLSETTSNKEGLFEVNVSNYNLKKDVTFIVENSKHYFHGDYFDGGYGFEYELVCKKNDTIYKKIEKIENRVDLVVEPLQIMMTLITPGLQIEEP